MAQSYKTSISFGLVYIPITLHAVIKNNDIGFNMLHKKTHSRIKYVKTCEDCPIEVKSSDIVKGFEYEDGKYVVLSETDFKKLKSKKDETITISQFAHLKEIDPIYFDKSYYVVPTGAVVAFHLLMQAMKDENKIAIAKVVLGNKETMVCLRVSESQMILSTMYFYEEVQLNPYNVKSIKNNEQELKLAKTIIKSLSKKFEPEKYVDEYRERVKQAIEDKINGIEIKAAKQPKGAKVINLLDALELTLKQSKQKPKSTPKTKTSSKSKTPAKSKGKAAADSKVIKMQKRA